MSFPVKGSSLTLDMVDNGATIQAVIPKGVIYSSLQWSRIDSNGQSVDIAAPAGTANPYVKTSADRGYDLSVRATGVAIGSRRTITVPATVPGAPLIGSATAGDKSVTAAFTAPADNGGTPITGYQMPVFRASDNQLLGIATGSSSPLTLTDLPNGVAMYAKVAALNAKGVGAQSAASNTVTPTDTSGRYMIASNGFTLATDWGIPDTNFSAAANQGATGRVGGNGTALGKYYRHRRSFRVGSWAAKAGRFLFSNWSLSLNGMLSGLFNIYIQRVEVRDTAGALVAVVKFDGAGNYTVPPAGHKWTDPLAVTLSADTQYYLDLWWYGDPSGAWPSGFKSGFLIAGEGGGNSLNTDLSLSAMPTFTAGASAGAVGGYFSASMFIAQGWDGSPTVFATGTSILDGTAPSASLATARGDIGFAQEAFGDATAGAWNYMIGARYSSSLLTLYQNNTSGFGGTCVPEYLNTVCQLVQSQPMFNLWYNEHGRNDIGGGTILADVQNRYATAVSKMRGLFPGIKTLQTTVPPWADTYANNQPWTNENDQIAHDAANSAGGLLQQVNTWIMSGGGGTFDFVADTAATVRSTTNYAFWKNNGGYSGTLLDAVTVTNSVDTVRLDNQPSVGQTFAFDYGSTQVDVGRVYTVISVVAASGGGWNARLSGGRASAFNPPTSIASKVQKTHAAGSPVKSILTADGLHPNYEANQLMKPALVAVKAAIRASIS